MVIRYTCEKCSAVLKINDDLAGSKGKCPKCKTTFVIPAPETDEDSDPEIEVPVADTKKNSAPIPEPAAEEEDDDLIDMPIDVTPDVDMSEDDEFDPMDGLYGSASTPAAKGHPTAAATPSPAAPPKPSIAELMREHEAAKQKKSKKKEKGSLEGAAAAAAVMTAGTAADALSRNYERKRGEAEPVPLTREEIRAQEERKAMVLFASKAGPIALGIMTGLYFLARWAFAEPLPDLEYVSGFVTQNNQPLPGVMVQFQPLDGADGMGIPSTGLTDDSGRYIMMFNPDVKGVVPGRQRVSIMTVSGLEYPIPEADREKTVTAGGDNTFNISL